MSIKLIKALKANITVHDNWTSTSWWKAMGNVVVKIRTSHTKTGNKTVTFTTQYPLCDEEKGWTLNRGRTWYGGDYAKKTGRSLEKGLVIARSIKECGKRLTVVVKHVKEHSTQVVPDTKKAICATTKLNEITL